MSDSPPAASARVTLAGSHREAPPGAVCTAAFSSAEARAQASVRITVIVRRRASLPAPAPGMAMTREAFAEQYGADPNDVLTVQRFAVGAGALVVETDLARCSIVLEAPLSTFADLFGAQLAWYESGGATFRARTGTLSMPSEMEGIVVGVFGIDARPQARTHFRFKPAAAAAVSYTPLQVATAYDFPSGLDGTGQTIALIELGGGYVQADLDTYFSGLGIMGPAVSTVGVDGGTNTPAGDPNSADGEVMLDIEVAGSIARGAKIVVYFAPNTDQGFIDAVSTAIHDTANKPSVVSISWGGPESSWTQQALTSFNDALASAAAVGVTVTVAAGDGGSTDGVTDGTQNVDFPASNPNVLACGGTTLRIGSGGSNAGETVWNDGAQGGATGGGISAVYPPPAYQQNVKLPPSANAGAAAGRGVPDVAGDADQETGYTTRVDGQDGVVGGTSAVAPLWAALIALLNQRRGAPLGFLNPLLYPLLGASPPAFTDITSGNNGAYQAGPGWDACTGLGSPLGTALAAALAAPSGTPPAS